MKPQKSFNSHRYAVQSATKFKAKIVDVPFCDPKSGFAILVASRIEDGKSIVLKGIIPNPVENAYITYQGHWEQDARRGTQYVKVESCKIDYEAGGTDSIYELLTSGYVPGVGPVTAKKIIKAFGADSLKIIEKSPEKLTELAGIKEKAAKKIHDAYIHIAKDQELISFLLPFISMQKINAVLKEYGDSKQALAAIKENPYCLYQDVSGIGFAASDRIALVGLGMDRKDQRRVEAIVLHSLEVQAQMEGHSFVWLNQLMACVATTVEKELHESRIPEQSIRDAVNGECFEMIVSRKTMQSEFALAYAMTVHKSQGSEFKAVVVAFDTGWKQLQQRNLLYTAVTRSKNECRIVGNMDAVDVAIDTNDIENRNSLLKNRLQHYNNEKYLDIHMTNFGTSGTDCFAE